jgi:tetratricopeptide (TPR) repeat protein
MYRFFSLLTVGLVGLTVALTSQVTAAKSPVEFSSGKIAQASNPQDAQAYYDSGNQKYDKDPQGALADYNQAIALNPKFAEAYYDRALLKKNKLNDVPGSLADYDQAIIHNPKYAEAYNNRAFLKYTKLNDKAGAIADLRQAVKYYREQGNTKGLQNSLNGLKELGATE